MSMPERISLDTAVDTWMLTLELRHADDPVGDHLLLMMAVHRLVLRLLAAMGEAIQQAVQREQDDTMEVQVEEDDDSIYMQLPTAFQQLLQELLHSLESNRKDSQPRVAEWLVDWLEHRCAKNARVVSRTLDGKCCRGPGSARYLRGR